MPFSIRVYHDPLQPVGADSGVEIGRYTLAHEAVNALDRLAVNINDYGDTSGLTATGAGFTRTVTSLDGDIIQYFIWRIPHMLETE